MGKRLMPHGEMVTSEIPADFFRTHGQRLMSGVLRDGARLWRIADTPFYDTADAFITVKLQPVKEVHDPSYGDWWTKHEPIDIRIDGGRISRK